MSRHYRSLGISCKIQAITNNYHYHEGEGFYLIFRNLTFLLGRNFVNIRGVYSMGKDRLCRHSFTSIFCFGHPIANSLSTHLLI